MGIGGNLAKELSKKDEDPGYEQVVERLEEVVKRLEAGNLPLEESLRAFEEGVALVRKGEARLTEAERRIEMLLSTPGGDKVVPFESDAREAERKTGSGRPDAAMRRPAGRAPERPEPQGDGPPPPEDAEEPHF
jgi:exodeoxyribonuclease VII small subunit